MLLLFFHVEIKGGGLRGGSDCFKILRCVLSLQEWKSARNKENRRLLMPDGSNKGRAKVRFCFPLFGFLAFIFK